MVSLGYNEFIICIVRFNSSTNHSNIFNRDVSNLAKMNKTHFDTSLVFVKLYFERKIMM